MFLSTVTGRKWAQLITSEISITHWSTRQIFSSPGLSTAVLTQQVVAEVFKLLCVFLCEHQYLKMSSIISRVLFLCFFIQSQGFKSNSVWNQVRVVSGGAWRHWTSCQLYFPGKSQEQQHGNSLIRFWKYISFFFTFICLSDPKPRLLPCQGSAAEHWSTRDDKEWEPTAADIWFPYWSGECYHWSVRLMHLLIIRT